jgi:tetratricopeptide (TPR) repeat protein
MQDRVAAAIVGALDLVLTPQESVRLAERPVENPQAYDRYLRARHELNRMTATSIQKAFEHLEEALALAPDNPFLLRGMGFACWSVVNAGLGPDRAELLERGRGYADAIEAVAPDSPFIAELRGLLALFEGRALEALRNLGAAYQALPEDLDIALWYGFLLGNAGHSAIAAGICGDVAARAPDHPLAWSVLSLVELWRGRFDEALAALGRAPDTALRSFVHLLGGLIHLAEGRREPALAAFERTAGLPDDPITAVAQFLGHACRGHRAAARATLTPEMDEVFDADFTYMEFVAQGFAILGDAEEAARRLGRAVERGLGIYGAITRHNAAWRPCLRHPSMVPVLARLRERSAALAAEPIAPRALALVTDQRPATGPMPPRGGTTALPQHR